MSLGPAAAPVGEPEAEVGLNSLPMQIVFRVTPFPSKWSLGIHSQGAAEGRGGLGRLIELSLSLP